LTSFDKALLALYSIIMGIVALFVLFLVIAGNIPYYLQLLFKNPDQRLIVGIIVVLIFIASIRLLFTTIGGSGKRAAQALIEDNHLGQVRITLEALENLVKRVALQVTGVKEVVPKIIVTPDGLKLLLKVAVTPDIPIPQASLELQTSIKEKVKEVAGIELKETRILVNNITNEYKARVE